MSGPRRQVRFDATQPRFDLDNSRYHSRLGIIQPNGRAEKSRSRCSTARVHREFGRTATRAQAGAPQRGPPSQPLPTRVLFPLHELVPITALVHARAP